MNIVWQKKCFDDLTLLELYDILKLRSDVFIVEQNEVYQDLDELDSVAWHLSGYSMQNELVSYARIIFPKDKTQPTRFGRVIVHSNYRNKGVGRQLLDNILLFISYSTLANHPIEISAQAHLEKFYGSYGFQKVGEPYYEGKILHYRMRKQFTQ